MYFQIYAQICPVTWTSCLISSKKTTLTSSQANATYLHICFQHVKPFIQMFGTFHFNQMTTHRVVNAQCESEATQMNVSASPSPPSSSGTWRLERRRRWDEWNPVQRQLVRTRDDRRASKRLNPPAAGAIGPKTALIVNMRSLETDEKTCHFGVLYRGLFILPEPSFSGWKWVSPPQTLTQAAGQRNVPVHDENKANDINFIWNNLDCVCWNGSN